MYSFTHTQMKKYIKMNITGFKTGKHQKHTKNENCLFHQCLNWTATLGINMLSKIKLFKSWLLI